MKTENKSTKSVKATSTKKVVKPATKTAVKPASKPAAKVAAPKKVVEKQPVKAEVVVENNVKVQEPVKQVEKTETKKITLNQEFNLVIGLLSLITIISFCFAFQGGDAEYLGWELFLNAGDYSGVFKGLMILYVVSIFIDCILAINIDTENEVLNIVEKALYMFTLIMNFIVVAVLLSIINKVGIGLLVFFIISIVSAIVKFARIYTRK